jgi:hypothetical protein
MPANHRLTEADLGMGDRVGDAECSTIVGQYLIHGVHPGDHVACSDVRNAPSWQSRDGHSVCVVSLQNQDGLLCQLLYEGSQVELWEKASGKHVARGRLLNLYTPSQGRQECQAILEVDTDTTSELLRAGALRMSIAAVKD